MKILSDEERHDALLLQAIDNRKHTIVCVKSHSAFLFVVDVVCVTYTQPICSLIELCWTGHVFSLYKV